MRALDTNVLVYAEIESTAHHATARELLRELSEGSIPWAIPWPCVCEFLRVVTHPRVFHPPVPPATALADLEQIVLSPSLTLLSEGPRHAEILAALLRTAPATGNLVHDAHIAALCLEHGVTGLLSGDRDFLRFSMLRVTDPFHHE